MQQAITGCATVIVVLSPDSVGSRSVLDEVSFALERGKQVVPVIFRACERPLQVVRLQSVDFSRSYPSGLAQLTRLLGGSSVAPAPRPPFWRRHRAGLAVAGMVAVLSAVAVIQPWRGDANAGQRRVVITALGLYPDTLSLLVGDSGWLADRAVYSDVAPAQPLEPVWRSSAAGIAAVRQRSVFGRAAGTASITANGNGIFATTAVIVRDTTGAVAGRVRNSRTGSPIAHARVAVSNTSFTAVSDASGYYVIVGIRPGRVTVRASRTGYDNLSMILVPVIAGDTVISDLELRTRSTFGIGINSGAQWRSGASSRVEGYVRDDRGAPVAAEVRVLGTSLRAATDPQGHYVIRDIPALPVTVQARSAAHAIAERRDVPIVFQRVSTIDFTLRRRA